MPHKKLITKVLQSYWRTSRGLHMDVAAVVTGPGGAVLLVRAPVPDAPWRLPGGPVLRGETAGRALARLLAEQAAIAAVEEGVLRDVLPAAREGGADQTLVYLVRCGQSQPGTPRSLEIAFFDPSRLPQPLAPGTAGTIAAIQPSSAPAQSC